MYCAPKWDKEGYIEQTLGLVLGFKYKIIAKLGQGSYSRVFKCTYFDDLLRKQSCAVKVNRIGKESNAYNEMQILLMIKRNDNTNESNCIHVIECFIYKFFSIFVFPLFGKSLYRLMQYYKYKPF